MGTAGWLALRTGAPLGWGVLVVGVLAALTILVAVLFGSGAGVAAGVALLGAAYAVAIVPGDGELDRASPAVAAALLAVAELGYWSLDLRGAVAYEPGMIARRLAVIASLTLSALAAGSVVMLAVEVPGLDGLGLTIAGAAAAAAAFVFLWRAAVG